jgi:hypothetical protein
MEEQGIIGTSTLYEPMHCLDHIGLVGDLTGVLRVVSQHDYILGPISVSLYQVSPDEAADSACLPIKNF